MMQPALRPGAAGAHQAAGQIATAGHFHLEVLKTRGFRNPKSSKKIFEGPDHGAFRLKAPKFLKSRSQEAKDPLLIAQGVN